MPDPGTGMQVISPRDALGSSDRRLVDVVDQLLDAGVVVRGEIWLTVADIELVFVGADLVLANPDTMRRGSEAPSCPTTDLGAGT